LDPWPSDDLLEGRIENFMKTEALIASAKQTEMSLEESVYQISLVDLKNLSKGVYVRDSVKNPHDAMLLFIINNKYYHIR
jgi:hypothetical protein